MLLVALMPSLSRAFAPQRDPSAVLLQLCSVGGVSKFAAAPDSDAPLKQVVMMDDCPYCRVQTDLPVLPPAPLALAISPLSSQHPPLFYHAPAPLFSWVAAHPRGPPLA
jgi:hypothetical protein